MEEICKACGNPIEDGQPSFEIRTKEGVQITLESVHYFHILPI